MSDFILKASVRNDLGKGANPPPASCEPTSTGRCLRR